MKTENQEKTKEMRRNVYFIIESVFVHISTTNVIA